MIAFNNVALRYGTGAEVLHDINFVLEPGSYHFLTGASGAGKSSLLRLLYLGIRPTRGKITLFGHETFKESRDGLVQLRRQVGVVFQDFRLLDHLSVFDNVALPLRIQGRERHEVHSHVTELLNWVGLGDHLHSKPSVLSGGQKQRVAIARAVIARPRLLLADEPTGNLDDQIGTRLMYLFDELNRMGTTMIVASHNEGLIRQFKHPRLHLANSTLQVLPSLAAAEENMGLQQPTMAELTHGL